MTHKELLLLMSFATEEYVNFTVGEKFTEMNRSLNSGEVLALSYFSATIRFLVKNGLLKAEDIKLELIQADCDPPEEDYL